jgi:AbrB family looped-hinge helix DNA binding protein
MEPVARLEACPRRWAQLPSGLPAPRTLLIIQQMLSVKISTKHQIAVPSEARKKLSLKAGDRLAVEVEGDVIHLRRHLPAGDRLYGIGLHLADGTDPAERIRAMRDADEARWVERQIEINVELRAAYAADQERG